MYDCQNGNYQVQEQCVNGCEVMSSGVNDRCMVVQASCPSGNGLYCGSVDSSLNNNTLYDCQNGNYQVQEQCVNGCETMSSGVNDRCMVVQASCPSGNGLYCGSVDSSLNNNMLYDCQNGNYQVREQCSNGCDVMPSGTNDRCSTGTGGSSSFPETNLYVPATSLANTSSKYATTENAFKNSSTQTLTGQCTWYAYGRVIELVDKGDLPSAAKNRFESAFWGTSGRHAKNWPSMLGGNWYKTVTTALPLDKRKNGLLAVWVDSGYGHVGFVEEISSDKTKYRLSDFNRGRDIKYRDKWYDFEGTSDRLLGTYPQFYDIGNPNW
ncbi:MAG: CHAP domain-containing protein [Candidatus Electrothrix sp. AR5]|nr:CHAP domain-containing protein [Candidatus Electrothrix sp. AR5]